MLGHGYQKRSVTERYIHSNPDALRPAADAIAGAIANSLGLTEPARVLAFSEQSDIILPRQQRRDRRLQRV